MEQKIRKVWFYIMRRFNVTVNGVSYDVVVEEVGAVAQTPVAAPTPVAAAPKAQAPAVKAFPTAAQGAVAIKAPMPGTIMKVNVTVGQAVKKGDVVLVLEAMKMENEIVAPQDGTVASIAVSVGASVESGEVMLTLN